jgi:hypothetical protein
MLKICKMYTLGLNEFHKLDGTSNFIPWKFMLQILLEEAKILEHVEKEIIAPTDLTQLASHVEKEAKAKRIIVDSVKDHSIPHTVDKLIGKLMYETGWFILEFLCL